MLDNIKKAAMNHAMKILSHPTVTKFISDPRVMNALGKGIQIHGQIRSHIEGKIRSIAESFNLGEKK
jgi:hypothetical protein